MTSLLGLNDGADSSYYIRFMPSTNSWRTGDEEVEIKYILIDPESVRSGWGKIQLGLAPDWHWDEKLGVRAGRPGNTEEEKLEYKRGFSVDLFGKEIGLRTWSATGTGATMGFDRLYSEIHAQLEDNAGLVPIVEYLGSDAIKVGTRGGNTRVPLFKIIKWVSTNEFDVEPPSPFEEPDDVFSDTSSISDELSSLNKDIATETSKDIPFDDEIPF